MVAKYGDFINQQQLKQFTCNFVKKLLGVKQTTQNDFIYGELGRIDFHSQRYLIIVKYWLKLIQCADIKSINVYTI